MKLRFDPDQPHQREAVAAVVDALRGQPRVSLADAAEAGQGVVANRLDLPPARILANVRAVQARAGLPQDEQLARIEAPGDATLHGASGCFDLSVEMETGTGKTYAYLRAALTSSRAYGLRKFVVVVPSVAVREGVLKTLATTREHFGALFPDVSYRWFAYDGSRLSRVRAFADGGDVDFMVVTIDAFNKASNLLRRPHDRFGGRVPLDVLRRTRPVLLLDEPQNLESELSRRSLTELWPLLSLRFSATHRRTYSLVHRLTPAQAHAQGLVKRLEVAGAPAGADDERARGQARIRETVALHLRRQAELRPRGIKVLSLFFVDRVDAYAGSDPWVRRAFDLAFESLRHIEPEQHDAPAASVRAAYFAPRAGRPGAAPVDSRTGDAAADRAAYVLIMRDKERLLSLQEPVAFVFSHSALREGWDNPNVFQICSLGRARSARRRRQEIGRGLRLCVDQSGRRVHDPAVDVLTVIADEDYESFVAGLQSEEEGALPPGERTPRPARAGQARDVAVPVATTTTARPSTIPPDFVPRVLSRYRSPAAPQTPARPPLPNLVDLVALALRHRPDPALVGRATILELLQRLPDRPLLVADPIAVAHHLADAIADTLHDAGR